MKLFPSLPADAAPEAALSSNDIIARTDGEPYLASRRARHAHFHVIGSRPGRYACGLWRDDEVNVVVAATTASSVRCRSAACAIRFKAADAAAKGGGR